MHEKIQVTSENEEQNIILEMTVSGFIISLYTQARGTLEQINTGIDCKVAVQTEACTYRCSHRLFSMNRLLIILSMKCVVYEM